MWTSIRFQRHRGSRPNTRSGKLLYAGAMNVLIPLPRSDFDPSEAALSWQTLRASAHVVTFATPDGRPATADPVMLTGIGLDFWSRIPALRQITLVGALLGADANVRAAHTAMIDDAAFRAPLTYTQLHYTDFDALL